MKCKVPMNLIWCMQSCPTQVQCRWDVDKQYCCCWVRIGWLPNYDALVL